MDNINDKYKIENININDINIIFAVTCPEIIFLIASFKIIINKVSKRKNEPKK